MSLTGAQLLTGFGRFIGDDWSSTTTSAGTAGGTTLVDTTLSRFGDDSIRDFYLRPTGATNQFQIRRITDSVGSTGVCTVAPAFSAQTASGQTYELHRYDPAGKFTVLDEARIRVYPDLGILRFADTLTGDGRTAAFDIPSTIRRGPLFILEEEPIAPDPAWNFLTSPRGEATTGWTASNTTASIVERDENDLLIPKYDHQCTKLATADSVNGTYEQVVGSMTNDITAALAAGRQMTFGAWVYCLTSGRVTLEITDDAGTTSSDAHGGAGWELLAVTRTISATNATTLTVGIDVASEASAVTCWWNRGWFYFGTADRITDIYHTNRGRRLRRDDTIQKVYLEWTPARGRQLVMIGRDTLSSLGTTAATQVTNTMEVDEEAAQVLYSEAARVLFAREGLNTNDFPDVANRIQLADRLRKELRSKWRMTMPQGKALVGPWVY